MEKNEDGGRKGFLLTFINLVYCRPSETRWSFFLLFYNTEQDHNSGAAAAAADAQV